MKQDSEQLLGSQPTTAVRVESLEGLAQSAAVDGQACEAPMQLVKIFQYRGGIGTPAEEGTGGVAASYASLYAACGGGYGWHPPN